MATEIIRFQLRRDSAANWALHNPVLAAGEPGIETDTGQEKIGTGAHRWVDLPYARRGEKGDKGVADDASVAQQVTSGPATVAALSATYVRFEDEAGNPLPTRNVVIKVSATTGEIIDIVSEA